MKRHPEIRWHEIARNAIAEYALRIKILDQLTAKSRFTDKDALDLGDDIKKNLAARYEKILKGKRSPRNLS